MKKRVQTIAATLLALGVIVGGHSFAKTRSTEANSIGATRAVKFALEDAGFTQDEVVLIKSEFDKENGQYIYEVDFVKDGVEYEYDILASNGAVVKKEIDKDDKTDQANKAPKAKQTKDEQTKANTAVSLEQAKEIALKDAGLKAADVTFTEAENGEENGQPVFELEFHTSTREFEYDIRKSDGAIITKEVDDKDNAKAPAKNEQKKNTTNTKQAPKQASNIGKDRARQIALNHAGVSSPRDFEIELESLNGNKVYEIEFESGDTEFNYVINAATGSIVHNWTEVERKAPTQPKKNTDYSDDSDYDDSDYSDYSDYDDSGYSDYDDSDYSDYSDYN